jgi:lipid-A-disaccharide synthase
MAKILISAGEVSGDQHLARVVRAIKAHDPQAEVRGLAGKLCAEAGALLDVDCYRAGAGMGFFELFRSGGKIVSSFRAISRLIREWRPDLLILVDYPDFNLRLAKVARRHGVRVLYFIPPKVWAWRSGRVKTIARYVDRVASIFPFEKDFYLKHGYRSVTYVGHPLGERAREVSGEVARDNNQLLLLPGSRKFEVERLLVPMLKAYGLLRNSFPELKPVVVLAPNIDVNWVKGIIGDAVAPELLEQVRWSNEDALLAMGKARVGVLKSGTCNLEGALAGLPFVCVYSGTLFAKVIVSTLVALKEYSPVNIIRKGTVRELMETVLSPDDVAREVTKLLGDTEARRSVVEGLAVVKTALCEPDATTPKDWQELDVSGRVAQCVFEMIKPKNGSCGSQNGASG